MTLRGQGPTLVTAGEGCLKPGERDIGRAPMMSKTALFDSNY